MQNVIVLGGSAGLGLFVFVLFLGSRMVRYVGNNRVAIVEKLWSRSGSVSAGLIALNDEAGYQPEVLRGGFHFFFPFQYRIHSQLLVTIPRARSAMFLPATARLWARRKRWPAMPRPPTFWMCGRFWAMAGKRGPSARSCARAPMPSTPRNS
jgi:hypothetical protein